MRGLFRGMTPRVIQTAPTMSIMMIVYDGINRFILRKQSHIDVSPSCVCSQTVLHPRTDYLSDLSALGTLERLRLEVTGELGIPLSVPVGAPPRQEFRWSR